jgi:hypothetical protein
MSSPDDDLQSLLLDGDTFVTEEKRQEAEAFRRREARRRRLQQLQADEPGAITNGHGNDASVKDNSAVDNGATANNLRDSSQSAAKDDNSYLGNLKEKEPYNLPARVPAPAFDRSVKERDEDNNASSNDEFDMFSNSVSPVEETVTMQTPSARGAEQADWDDAEGYYRGVIGEVIRVEHTTLDPNEGAATSKSDASMAFRVAG